MDRISSLPTPILHDILSSLPDKDAVRIRILSKAWKQVGSTFPVLIHHEPRECLTQTPKTPQQRIELMRKRNDFLNGVDSTLRRFHDQDLGLKKFKVKMGVCERGYRFPRIDSWIELASGSGVEVLQLELVEAPFSVDYFYTLGNTYCNYYYFLPRTLLEAKTLTKLILSGRAFRFGQEFLNRPIKLSWLRVLSLTEVGIEDDCIIQNLISSCPLIEYITLWNCSGLKSVTICGLPKLKGVEVSEEPLSLALKVVVDAPSLESFHCRGASHLPCIELSEDSLRNLRGLTLSGSNQKYEYDIGSVERLPEMLPLLESLVLEYFHLPDQIHISSLHLKILMLNRCYKLMEAHIDAPNLYSFSFDADAYQLFPAIYFLNTTSSQLEVNVHCHIQRATDLERLKKSLQDSQFRNAISLSVRIIYDWPFGMDRPPAEVQNDSLLLPPRVKQLELYVNPTNRYMNDELRVVSISPLLWCCRPAIISMKLDSSSRGYHTRFIQKYCERMMLGKSSWAWCYCQFNNSRCRSGRCDSSISAIKSCWQALKDVKVTTSSMKNPVGCETFLKALPTLPQGEDIFFTLEW